MATFDRRGYYQANRQEALDYAKAYREAHPENVAEHQRLYRERHRDELRAKARARYVANREKVREAAKAAYAANPEFYRAQAARYRAKRDPGVTHAWHLRDRYGMSLETYSAMMEAQGGLCAICGKAETARRHQRLSVDHDHTCCPSGKTCGRCVRGLLCHHCNATLGHLERVTSVEEWVAAAARYLSATKQPR